MNAGAMQAIAAKGLGRPPSTLRRASRSVTSSASSAAQRPSTLRAIASAAALTGGALAAGYALALFYPPELVRLIAPRIAPAAPTADSAAGIAHTHLIEQQLQNLELVKKFRSEGAKWEETRPYANFDESRRRHSLTQGSLRGPGKMAVPPLCFATPDDREAHIFIHLGRSLCGHDGVIHGGLLATLLDEGIARPAILSLPSKLGMTAYLNITYKAPTMADQFVHVHTYTTKVEGRKAFAEGKISTLDGKVLVEAKALFVEPKFTALLDSSQVAAALGKKTA